MLEKVKSAIGTAVADQVTGTIILLDTPDKIREMKAVIEKADISTIARVVPTVTKTFTLQHAKVADIQAQIQPLLSKDAGSLHADLRTKTIIVSDVEHNMEKIENVVKTFDRMPRQVFVEAKVVEVALGDEYSLGINWNHMFEALDPRFSLNTVSTPGAAAVPTFKMNYNTITTGGDLQVVLEALKSVGDTKILSNPQIAVMDGEEATIEVIEDQPYKEVSIESGTTNITGVSYIFKPVGVLLNVTPRINDEQFITCSIKPEISSISQWYDGAPQEGTPVIKKAHAETTVMVKDGVTIIIGGLIKDRKDEATSSVPILGSLPLIGRFFRYETVSSVNSETVVFLTPRIITGDEPFLRMRDLKKMPKPLRSVGVTQSKQIKPIR
jgi:type II secretory pathway component GspD/PulD (secretin)